MSGVPQAAQRRFLGGRDTADPASDFITFMEHAQELLDAQELRMKVMTAAYDQKLELQMAKIGDLNRRIEQLEYRNGELTGRD